MFEAIALLIFLGITGYSVFNSLCGEKELQKQYEADFLTRYEDISSTTSDLEEIETLLNLCIKFNEGGFMKRISKEYKVGVEVQYVGFRKIKPTHDPIRTEIVRCNDKCAFVGAKDGFSSYALEKGTPQKGIEGTIFYILTTVIYKRTVDVPPRPSFKYADSHSEGLFENRHGQSPPQSLEGKAVQDEDKVVKFGSRQ